MRHSVTYTETSYADAFSVEDDVILAHVELGFDSASHAVQVTLRQRYHNAPDSQTGALADPGADPKARVTYQARWLDGTGREVAVADYGTNGGSSLTRPSSIPTPSDTILVSTAAYDPAGMVNLTTDPAGIVTFVEFDDAGRRVTVIENYVVLSSSSSSSPSGSSGNDCAPSDDRNRTTRFTFTPDGQQATLTAENSETGNQTTTWTYGTTLSNSDVATSLLLRSIAYPDSTSGSDQVNLTYNRLGQRTSMTDQNGTVHHYDYDLRGRLIEDRVRKRDRSNTVRHSDCWAFILWRRSWFGTAVDAKSS